MRLNETIGFFIFSLSREFIVSLILILIIFFFTYLTSYYKIKQDFSEIYNS